MLDWAQNCSANVGEMPKVVNVKCELKIFVDLNDRVNCHISLDYSRQDRHNLSLVFPSYLGTLFTPLRVVPFKRNQAHIHTRTVRLIIHV